jgi:adenine-specific DNA-methyltransferase
LDTADLDFIVYRLFRPKRDEIEAFLEEQLPRRVGEAFQAVADEGRAALEREVAELAEHIRREVADEALVAAGEPQPNQPAFQARLAREFLEEYVGKRRALEGLHAFEAEQAEAFSHLYAFFSRYYEGGDFIPADGMAPARPTPSSTAAKGCLSTGPTRTSTTSRRPRRCATTFSPSRRLED